MVYRLLVVAILLSFTDFSIANDCLGWFLKSGLASKASDCEVKCSVTPVDMSTFSCPNDCQQLCSKTLSEQILSYVPRLTEGDKMVIAKMPYEAYRVFLAKEKVNTLTGKIFKSGMRKDESDAFRHFVWSVLLAQDIGVEKAQIFLTAHEQDSTQDQSEKKMDEYNNKQGISFFLDYKKSASKEILELDKIEAEALNRLKKKKLKVLKSRFKQIPEGYYSK